MYENKMLMTEKCYKDLLGNMDLKDDDLKERMLEMIQANLSMGKYHDWAFEQIEAYFVEKGVDYRMGGPLQSASPAMHDYYIVGPEGFMPFMLLEVPQRLYHEVVVPGLRELCGRVHVLMQVLSYAKRDDLRFLDGRFKLDANNVPISELIKASNRV
jgi:hypothetical protein